MTSQGIKSWAFGDLPFQTGSRDIEKENESIAEYQTFLDSLNPLRVEASADYGIDPELSVDLETGDLVRGTWNVTEAMAQGTYSGYSQGYLERNQAFDKYTANMILGFYRDEKLKGTLLEFDGSKSKLLEYYARKSPWNLQRLVQPFQEYDADPGQDMWDFPILATNFNETPDDLFKEKAPEGWDPEQALMVLKLKDPEIYAAYLNAFGNEENMFALVKNARNPYEFFHNLANENQQISLGKAINAWYEKADSAQVATEYAYNFIIEGIVNDPDLAASIGISAGLGAVTAGAGGLAGLLASLGVAGLKGAKKLITVAKWAQNFQRFTAAAQRYLPENLGPSVIQLSMGAKRVQGMDMMGRIGTYTLGNAAEGFVTGGLAEISNQYRLSSSGIKSEFSWGDVGIESVFEMLLSPVINPVIGGAYKLVGFTGQSLNSSFALLYDPIIKNKDGSKKGALKAFDDFIGKAKGYLDANSALSRIEQIELRQELEALLGDLTLEGTSIEYTGEGDPDPITPAGALGLVLQTLRSESGLDTKSFLEAASIILGRMKEEVDSDIHSRQRVEESMVVAELAQSLVLEFREAIVEANAGSEAALNNVVGWTLHHLAIAENAKNFVNPETGKSEPKTYKEYVDYLVEEDRQFELVPAELRQLAKERWQKGKTFDEPTRDADGKITSDPAQKAFDKLPYEEKLALAYEAAEAKLKEETAAAAELDSSTAEADGKLDALDDKIDPPPAVEPDTGPEASDTTTIDTTVDDDKKPAEETETKGRDPLERAVIVHRRAKEKKEALDRRIKELGVSTEGTRKKRNKKLKSLKGFANQLNEIIDSIEADLATYTSGIGKTSKEVTILFTSKLELSSKLKEIRRQLLADSEDDKGFVLGIEKQREVERLMQQIVQVFISHQLKLGTPGKLDPKKIKIEVSNLGEEFLVLWESIAEVLESVPPQPDGKKGGPANQAARIRQFAKELRDGTQTTLTNSTVQNYAAMIESMVSNYTKRLLKTKKAKEEIEVIKELKRVHKELNAIRSRMFKQETLALVQSMKAIQLQQAGVAERKQQQKLLDAKTVLFEDMMRDKAESGENVTYGELMAVIHPYSEWLQTQTALANEDPSVAQTELTQDEAKEIFGRETSANQKKISYLGVGKVQEINFNPREVFVRGKWEHESKDGDVIGTTYDAEEVTRKSEEGKPLGTEESKPVETEEDDFFDDGEGNDFIVYHGSPNTELTSFEVAGPGTGTYAGMRLGRGAYFTNNPDTAQDFAGDGGRVYKARIRNRDQIVLGFDENETNLAERLGVELDPLPTMPEGIPQFEIVKILDKRAEITANNKKKIQDALEEQGIDMVVANRDGNYEIMIVDPSAVEIMVEEEAPKEKTDIERSVESDLKGWIELESNLRSMQSTASTEKGLVAWRMNLALGSYMRDYLGLGPFAAFGQENILGPEHSALMELEGYDLDAMNFIERRAIQHILRYDIDKVLDIVKAWKERTIAVVDGPSSLEYESILEALIKDSNREEDINSVVDLRRAVKHLEHLESASAIVNQVRFQERQKGDGGYITEVDSRTGYPIVFTKDPLAWKGQVQKHLTDRVNDLTQRDLIFLAEKFGMVLETETVHGKENLRFKDDLGKVYAKKSEIVDMLSQRIMENPDRGFNPNMVADATVPLITIEDLGNGVAGYGSALQVGYAIVDEFTKPQPARQPLMSVREENGNVVAVKGSESVIEGGRPSQVTLPQRGDLNMAMVTPLHAIAALVNNFRARERMRFILSRDSFTETEKAAFKTWVEAKWSDVLESTRERGGPIPVGRRNEPALFIVPQIVGQDLQSRVLQRDEAKKFILELLLDIPRMSESFIHDQVTMMANDRVMFNEGIEDGVVLRFNEGDTEPTLVKRENLNKEGGLMLPISHGDHILVPLGRIGEIMAIESMGPQLKGLTKAAIQGVISLRERNNIDEVTLDSVIDPRNWSDRTASVRFEMKLLSLANDPTATTAVTTKDGKTTEMTAQDILQKIFTGVFGDAEKATKAESDFYLNTAFLAAKYYSGPDGPLAGLFKAVRDNELDSAKTYQDKKESMSEEDVKKIELLRGIFKVPVMRKVYGGGQQNYDLEFSRGQKGYEALQKLRDDGDVNSEEVAALKKVLYTKVAMGVQSSLIDYALGVNDDTKLLVSAYLGIDQNMDMPLLNRWNELLKLDDKELSSRLKSIEGRMELLESKLQQFYNWENPGIPYEKWKKQKGYEAKFDKALKFLMKKKEEGDNVNPGTASYDQFTQILSGLVDKDGNQKLAAEQIGYFRALNILNSQQYEINMNRLQQVADAFGMRDFDIKDFLGLESHALYHLLLPSSNSGRVYTARSGMGLDTQGIWAERVARVDPYVKKTEETNADGTTRTVTREYESFFAYVEEQKKNDPAYTEDNFKEDLHEYLTDPNMEDPADAFGMFDLANPDARKFETREEAEKAIEDLMIKQDMIAWSSYDRLPPEIFPDYTIENNDLDLTARVLQEWEAHASVRHGTLTQEIEYELDLFHNHGGINNEILKARSKANMIVSEEVASLSNGAFTYSPYHIEEGGSTAAIVNTSGARGGYSMRPKYKTVQYYDSTLYSLQRLNAEERILNTLGPISRIAALRGIEPEDAIIGGVSIGHASAWNTEDLPNVLPSLPAALQSDVGTRDGVRAAKLWHSVNMWAAERGLEKELELPLDPSPEDIARQSTNFVQYFMLQEIERARQNILYRTKEDDLLSESDLTERRNRWLEDLYNISSISRDLNSPEGGRGMQLFADGEPVVITNPVSDEATWITLLQDVMSEDNPNGVLLRRSLLDKAFRFGETPAPNLVLVSEEMDNHTIFEHKDLAQEGWAVQNADFNKFLAGIIYREAWGYALQNFTIDGNTPYVGIALDPNSWEAKIAFEHRETLEDMARAYVQDNSQSFVFNVGIEERLYDDLKNGEGKQTEAYRLVLKRGRGQTTERGTVPTSVPQAQRNVFGEAGFAMQIMSKTKIKASNATLTLDPAHAMQLFTVLENQRSIHSLTLSNWLNKGLGVALTEEGNLVRAKPLQDSMRNVYGYDVKPIMRAAIETSEALKRATAYQGDSPLLTVQDEKRSIDGRPTTVVDLDSYTDGNTLWRKSYSSPVRKTIALLENSNLIAGSEELALRNQLALLLENAESGKTPGDFVLLKLVSLALEQPSINLRGQKAKVFMNELELKDVETYHNSIHVAEDIVAKIKIMISDDGVIRNIPLYYEARQFLLEAEIESVPAMVSSFKAYLDTVGSSRYSEAKSDKAIIFALNFALADYNKFFTNRPDAVMGMDIMLEDASKIKSIVEIMADAENEKLSDLEARLGADHAPLVRNAFKNIQALVSTHNLLSKGEAVAIKTMLLRAFEFNPEILRNLKFEGLTTRLSRGAEAERKGSEFTIRLGSNFKNLTRGDSLTAIQIVAHELGHIARLKFIKDNGREFAQLQSLWQSNEGRAVMRKIVMAWHGGSMTRAAKTEFDTYKENFEEFLAAYSSYYLLGKTAPYIAGLGSSEQSLVGKLIFAIRKMLSHVFLMMRNLENAFVTGDSKFDKQLQDLGQKIWGYAEGTSQPALEVFDSHAIADKVFGWTERMPEADFEIDSAKDSEIKAMALTMKELEAKKRSGEELTEDEKVVEARIVDKINTPGTYYSATYGLHGMTRYLYLTTLDEVRVKFPAKSRQAGEQSRSSGAFIIDASEALGPAATLNEKAATLIYLSDNLKSTYGDPITRNLGTLGSRLENIPGVGRIFQRQAMADVLLGGIGASSTWNANFLLPLMLTSLMDDSIVTLSGSYTNVDGTPSVTQVMKQLAVFTSIIKETKLEIVETLNGKLRNFVRDSTLDVKRDEVYKKLSIQMISLITPLEPGEEAHVIDLSEEEIGYKLDDKAKETIEKAMKKLAEVYRQMSLNNIHTGQMIGEYSDGFNQTVPYRLTTKVNDEPIILKDTMISLFKENLTKRYESEGLLDGTVMIAAGLIPHLNDRSQAIKDFQALQKNHPLLYNAIVTEIVLKEGDPEGVRVRVDSFSARIVNDKEYYAEAVQGRLPSFLNKLALGTITRNTIYGTESSSSFNSKYTQAVEDSSKVDSRVMKRLDALTATNVNVRPNLYLKTMNGKEHTSRMPEHAKTPIEFIYQNFYERASRGSYRPNDNWLIPSVKKALQSNENIKEHLIIDLSSIAETAKQGHFDEIGEKKMMREFGIHGTVGDVLALVGASLGNQYGILGPKGEAIDKGTTGIMLDVLENKYNAIKKIREKPEDAKSGWVEENIPEYANAFTRIAYGSNLFLATSIVETGYSALDELFGRQNITGFLRSSFSHFSQITNREERNRVLKDFAYLIENMTQGHLPTYERPIGAKDEAGVLKFLKGWGAVNMRMAKWQLANLTAARAISARSFISNYIQPDSKGNNRLFKLVEEIDKLESGVRSDADLKTAMRKAGIPYKANLTLVSYMFKTGLLQADRLIMLTEMLPETGRYSPNEMANTLFKTLSPDTDKIDYNKKLEIIGALKSIEESYVGEAIVAPNPFDTKTTPLGGLGAVWEIYRRYPTLFVAQQLMRKSSRVSIPRMVLGMSSLLILDMLYMTALSLAAGEDIEDIIEDYTENPTTKFGKLIARTPIFGRFAGFLAPAVATGVGSLVEGKSVNDYDIIKQLNSNTGMIPAAALGKSLGNMLTLGKAAGSTVFDWESPTGRELINSMGFLPAIDSSFRLAGHLIAGTSGQEKRKSPGSRASSGMGAPMHYGFRRSSAEYTWEREFHQFSKELFGSYIPPSAKAALEELDIKRTMSEFTQTPAAAAPAPQQPAPPEIATPTSKPENVVDSIIDRKAEDAPDSLFGGN